MHPRLGSATLSQLAFPGEGNPNFPWEKSHWDNTVVEKKKKGRVLDQTLTCLLIQAGPSTIHMMMKNSSNNTKDNTNILGLRAVILYWVALCTEATFFIIIIIINPLPPRVVGVPQIFCNQFSPFSLFSTALWDLPNSRLVHILMLSSHLFLCPPCLLPPFTVPCKMVWARPDERETRPYNCSLRLFTIVRRSSCAPIACWILARASRW